jgi:hypothetical protein
MMYDVSRFLVVFILLAALFCQAEGPVLSLRRGGLKGWAPPAWMFESLHIPYSFALVYLIAIQATPLACLAAALVQIAVLALNWGLKRLQVIEKCNCYGAMATTGSRNERVLNAALLLGCGYLAWRSALDAFSGGAGRADGGSGVLLAAAMLAVLASAVLKARSHGAAKAKAAQASQAAQPAAAPVRPLPQPGDLLGYTVEGQALTYGASVASGKPVMVVGLSRDCAVCAKAKPNLFQLAEAFHGQIQTLFLYLEDPQPMPAGQPHPIVAGHSKATVERAGVEGFPYALLVDAASLKTLAPVVYGPNKIWMLYFMALGLLAESR